jgi:hypothetical protein
MGEFIKQLKVDNNERISTIKFVNSAGSSRYNFGSGDFLDHSSSPNNSGSNKYLLIAHSDKVSILSAKDNFTKRHTFSIGDHMNVSDGSQMRINRMEFNEQDQTVYLSLQSHSSR